MSACIIRRKSNGMYRSRNKSWWEEEKRWVSDVNKARIFTNVVHAKVSLRDTTSIINVDSTRVRRNLTYTCENCCSSKYHYCNKHKEMFLLLKKWLLKAIDNNFNWSYEVIPVKFEIGN